MGRRKIKIDPSWIEFLASIGLTHQQIAAHVGVSEDTLMRRSQQDEQIARALNVDRRDVYVAIAQSLVDAALKGDVRAQIFYLRNHAGWNPPVAPTPKQVNLNWAHLAMLGGPTRTTDLPAAALLPGSFPSVSLQNGAPLESESPRVPLSPREE